MASIISDFDDNVLKLLHYFVTVRGYNQNHLSLINVIISKTMATYDL